MLRIDPNAPIISNKKSTLTKLAEISTIVALFISLMALVIATYYAFKTYHLTIETSNNREQINRLDTLIILNTSSIHNLTEVANELKTQNKKLADVNSQLLKSFGESKLQSKILSNELSISTLEQSKTNANYNARHKADSIQFYYSMLNLNTEFNPKSYLNYDSVKQLKYLLNVESIINREMQNFFLLSNDSLYVRWKQMKDQISFWQKSFVDASYEGFVEVSNDSSGNLIQLRGLAIWRKNRNQQFVFLINEIYKLFWNSFYEIRHVPLKNRSGQNLNTLTYLD